jgi:hypothetical protein
MTKVVLPSKPNGICPALVIRLYAHAIENLVFDALTLETVDSLLHGGQTAHCTVCEHADFLGAEVLSRGRVIQWDCSAVDQRRRDAHREIHPDFLRDALSIPNVASSKLESIFLLKRLIDRRCVPTRRRARRGPAVLLADHVEPCACYRRDLRGGTDRGAAVAGTASAVRQAHQVFCECRAW